jgi:hypothetical protein
MVTNADLLSYKDHKLNVRRDRTGSIFLLEMIAVTINATFRLTLLLATMANPDDEPFSMQALFLKAKADPSSREAQFLNNPSTINVLKELIEKCRYEKKGPTASAVDVTPSAPSSYSHAFSIKKETSRDLSSSERALIIQNIKDYEDKKIPFPDPNIKSNCRKICCVWSPTSIFYRTRSTGSMYVETDQGQYFFWKDE